MSNCKAVYIPYHDKTFRLGRHKPKENLAKLQFSTYLKSLPTPPNSCDYSPRAQSSLSKIYLNDKLGDCVIACMAHVVGVMTANAGNEVLFPDKEIISLYSAIGGYVPGRPRTDQGCNEQTALNYWLKKGTPSGHKINGWLAINPKKPNEYKLAMYLFENLIYGIGLPDSWLNNAEPGFVWDEDRPNENNGHCICAVGYDEKGTKVATWGMLGTLTDRAHAADVDELYVVISEDMINKAQQKAPNDLNWSQLVSDFNAFGGNLPVPPDPNPLPPDPPVPPSPTPNNKIILNVPQVIIPSFKITDGSMKNFTVPPITIPAYVITGVLGGNVSSSMVVDWNVIIKEILPIVLNVISNSLGGNAQIDWGNLIKQLIPILLQILQQIFKQ